MASGSSTSLDPAFVGAGQNEGVEIWRIEAMKPVRVPEALHGQFHEGDTYLVLATHPHTRANTKLAMDLHIWIGKDSSQDEYTVAAYKAVELDDALHGVPVQHREEQGHESPLFLSHFRAAGGIIVLPGGVASGFSSADAGEPVVALLHVKGARNAVALPVPVAAGSLNHGDVFILDKGNKLFLWYGKESNSRERACALALTQALHNSRGARTQRIVMADAEAQEVEEFWSTLHGSVADVAAAVPDDDVPRPGAPAPMVAGGRSLKLFKVSDATGALNVEPIPIGADGRLTRDMLPQGDVMLVDTVSQVFVWVGKGATADEKREALRIGHEFCNRANEDGSTRRGVRVTVLHEHGETPEFKALFYRWDPARTYDFSKLGRVSGDGVVAGTKALPIRREPIDFTALAEGKARDVSASDTVLDDGGAGRVSVSIIRGHECERVPEDKVGQFFSGDSFIVQYDMDATKQHILYFWLGRQSDVMEQGTAALNTVRIADELASAGGRVTQVRVVQGAEPPHFASLFRGKMVIHAGDAGPDLHAKNEGQVRLYHVKGTSLADTKAVEVSPVASSLNSGDVFILAVPAGVGSAAVPSLHVWQGKGSNDEERAVAANIAAILARGLGSDGSDAPTNTVTEGAESDLFWSALGGPAEYPESVPHPQAPQSARLFHVSDVTGTMHVSEVHRFTQADLNDNDVLLLDTFNQVFVWVGRGASPQERTQALPIAQQYIQAATELDGRDSDTPIVRVAAGAEPLMFTCNFHGWSQEVAAGGSTDPYQARLEALRAERAAAQQKLQTEAESRSSRFAAAAAAVDQARSAPPAEAPNPDGSGAGAIPTPSRSGGKGSKPTIPSRAAPSSTRKQDTTPPPAAAPAPSATLSSGSFTVDELRAARRDTDGPLGTINFAAKETYLSDKDFSAVFAMDRAAFTALPKWRRDLLKKNAGLF